MKYAVLSRRRSMASGVRTPSLDESLLMPNVLAHVRPIRIASAAIVVAWEIVVT